ncbi:MAG: M20/M25/M40 family metallo-hydrolase [Acidobacteriota bacterium]|nr:M20/M25/M40 family metallo-hydrolase [Acidobacteriota bacterium]
MVKRAGLFFAIFLVLVPELISEEKIDAETNWRIRREATENSQILYLVRQLSDIHGPRLTGSPNFNAACNWALRQMERWGLQNENLEKWDFGHAGWSCDTYSVRVLSPFKETLSARVVAWTPGTRGVVRAKVVQILPPERPTEESLSAYLNTVKNKVRDRIVLAGNPTVVPVQFNASYKRREDSELRAQFDPQNPAPPAAAKPPEQPTGDSARLDPQAVEEKISAFLLENRALVRISDSARSHGQIRVFANRTYNTARSIPGVVIRNEDYGRLSRLIAEGFEPEMEIEISNSIHADELTSRNVIAEIPGSDLKNQVVMIGAHLDSWHGGTGATDNATGVAVMMEAARILQKLGIRARRTIRVALWGGEEQGLLGSKAYVRDHFGTFESQKPEFSQLSAYLNLDSGTGRVRGAYVFGPAEAADVLRRLLEPFSDLGVMGASAIKARSHGGTDSTSFNYAGLPGINLIQDPIEYITHTWHTDLDTYERVLEEDLKQCAIVVASLAYHLAMREEMLPRFTGDAMPEQDK